MGNVVAELTVAYVGVLVRFSVALAVVSVGAAAFALGIPVSPDLGSYALVGMAATAAATSHAPLTAAVLVFELTGDYPVVSAPAGYGGCDVAGAHTRGRIDL